MLDSTQLVVAALAVMAGSIVLSVMGFGIGLTASPALLLVLDPQTVVVTLNTVSVGLLALVVVHSRSALRLGEIAPPSVAGILGVPFGVFALSSIDAGALRIGITVLILLLTAAVALNLRGPASGARVVGPLVGFVVGALVTGLAIGGPLMVLFLLGRGWPRQAVRASASFYYLAISTAAVVGYSAAGLFSQETTTLILIVAAPALLGFAVATAIVRRLDERSFRRGVVGVITVTSLAVLGRELLRL